jgi:hypothetical protein
MTKRAIILGLAVIALVGTWLLLGRSRSGPVAGPPLVEAPSVNSTPAPAPAPAQAEAPGAAPATRAARPARALPKFVEPTKPKFVPRALDYVMKQRRNPLSYLETEKRNRVWAPAMEKVLQQRFQELARENGTPGFKVTEVDCRESACRLDMEYQPSDVEAARAAGALDPYYLARNKAGGLASFTYLVQAPPEYRKSLDPDAWVQPDGSIRKKLVLVFGEEDIDPAHYVETTARWAKADREGAGR